MRRWATWSAVICLGGLAGSWAGNLLDCVVWHVSFDYVYAPGQFAQAGWRWGLFGGAVAAAVATLGTRPAARPRTVLVSLGWAAACLASGAALGSLAGGILGKLSPAEPPDLALAPLPRLWFCQGLWRGACLGSAVGTAAACWRLWRGRRVAEWRGPRIAKLKSRKAQGPE